MSQMFNLTQKEFSISPSMMTFKEYYMSFIDKEPYLANGWGWFVDIELDYEPITITKPYNHYKSSHYVSIPKTIKEYPSIRSMKSMKNLHDTSMIFDMDEDLVNNRSNNNCLNILTHTLGFIGLVLCYFITRS